MGEELEDLKKLIVAHSQSMESEYQCYFPGLEEQKAILEQKAIVVQNPRFSICIPDEIQDEYFDLEDDLSARILYLRSHSLKFWREMYNSYPQISKLAFQVLLSFFSTYLCDSVF